jgi:hypothetical protein
MKSIAKLASTNLILFALVSGCGGGSNAPPVASSDAMLSALTVSAGALTPAFDSGVTSYDVTVAAADTSIMVTPTTSGAGATVTVGGNAVAPGTASPAIALTTGDNTIPVVVTAEDGTMNTYTLSVYRLSNDTTLTSLRLSFGVLDQVFQSSLFNYTSTVGYLQSRVRVTADITHVNATMTINGVAVGSGVASDSIPLVVGQNIITITVAAEDGIATDSYVIDLTRQDATNFAQRAYTKASNTGTGDHFGNSVAVYGDTMAVGAYNEASATTGINGNQADDSGAGAGAVYVFTRDAAGAWSQQAYIKASNAEAGDRFGSCIALSADTMAVGAPHEASAATVINGDQTDNNATRAGAVYVFSRDAGGIWSQQAYVKASNNEANDEFGVAIGLSGDTLVVGAHQEDSSALGINGGQGNDATSGNSGAVYVFTRDAANTWTQQAYIKASNTGAADRFGSAVSLSSDTLAVGAYAEQSAATGIGGDQTDNTAGNAGAAYVFTRDGTDTWSQQAYLKASNTNAGDWFGQAVFLSGDTLVVGAPFEDSTATGINGDQSINIAGSAGAAYVFTRDGAGTWSQAAYIKASNTGVGDRFGASVAVSDDAFAVFAPSEDGADFGIGGTQTNNSAGDSGAVYVFTRDAAGIWAQDFYVKASNTDAGDEFGGAIAISADTLASGAQFESSGATGVDGDQADNTAAEAGAIYVFE